MVMEAIVLLKNYFNMNPVSRRSFLENLTLASVGISILSSNSVVNALTREESPFQGYNPYFEEKTDLRTSAFSSEPLIVKGKIYDSSGDLPLPNVLIDAVHLSPHSSKYGNAGKFRTNNQGEYSFITDFPNRKRGKMPRIRR